MWYVLGLNPEPWAVGPLSVGRSGGRVFPRYGRNEGLYAYQQGVKEEISSQSPVMVEGKLKIRFYFWRQQVSYETPQARTARKHEADATNLQKALEDALQGVLYKNDKDVSDIASVIVDQGPDVQPCIVISIERYAGLNASDIPADVYDKMQTLYMDRNAWPDDEDAGF